METLVPDTRARLAALGTLSRDSRVYIGTLLLDF
jgi:hypothetical protein